MTASVYSRALRKAAEILGGTARLARHLQVPESDLRKWLAGEAKPPKNVFLRAVDLVIDESAAAASSDAPDSPSPRDCADGSSSSQYS